MDEEVVAPFATWIIVASLSSLANPDWLGNLVTLRHQYRIFLPLALLVSLKNVNLRRLLLVYLSLVCLISLYSWLQSYFAIDVLRMGKNHPFDVGGVSDSGQITYRARGFFVGPGILGNHMMMTGLLFAALAIGCRDRLRAIWALGGVMAMAGLMFSIARGPMLGTVIGFLILSIQLQP